MDKDLFDLDDEPQTPEDDQPVVEEEVEPESNTEVEDEAPAEEEENAEEAASDDQHDDDNDEEKKDDEGDDEEEDKTDSPTEARPAGKKPEESKPVNVVEQDPYNFDQCLITIALALMPDDGNPEGRPVMLGVRNHQDEPLMGTCRLSDLMPLPDPVQQLIEQLKADLPVRSERTAKRRKDEEDKRKAALEKSKKKTPGIKPASAKAKKAGPASVNLFEMFDQ